MNVIINYGSGNLNSVAGMVKHLGFECKISSSYAEIENARKLILPGVGAFDSGMKSLLEMDYIELLKEKVQVRETPILGICLGMQLMTEKSEEGTRPGLGWIKAEAVKFKASDDIKLKVPHMGWNSVKVKKNNPLISQETEQRFYFVHSYHVQCKDPDDIMATSFHGNEFVAAFSKNNIFGVQFHPEKSHRFGMALIRNFLEL